MKTVLVKIRDSISERKTILNSYLTVKQLSEYFSIKPKTIYSLVSRKTIPHYKIGKLVLFKQDEVDTWINTKRVMPIDIDKLAKSFYTSFPKGSRATSRREAMK